MCNCCSYDKIVIYPDVMIWKFVADLTVPFKIKKKKVREFHIYNFFFVSMYFGPINCN